MKDNEQSKGSGRAGKRTPMNKTARQETGKLGEEWASSYLLANEYHVTERNWRCRSGEIDLIAELAGRLVFIEVRTRRHGGRFGTAAESVDRRKQQQVRETAQVYMRSRGMGGTPIRFDVIAIVLKNDDTVFEYNHYEGAF